MLCDAKVRRNLITRAARSRRMSRGSTDSPRAARCRGGPPEPREYLLITQIQIEPSTPATESGYGPFVLYRSLMTRWRDTKCLANLTVAADRDRGGEFLRRAGIDDLSCKSETPGNCRIRDDAAYLGGDALA